MLVATSLRLGYGATTVLDGVSLAVRPGEAIALLGPNGAGKSTLLRALAGLHASAAGSVELDGRPLAAVPRRTVARRLAFVPQEFALLFPFRVAELVLLGRYAHRPLLTGETDADRAAARAALERTELWGLRDRRFDELSGGERRRVLLAQALCQQPALLLLDEPTASLDVSHAVAFFDLLAAERSRGLALVVATHDLSLAARYLDRAALLRGGRVAAHGPTLDVLASPEAERAFGLPLHLGRTPREGRPFCVPA